MPIELPTVRHVGYDEWKGDVAVGVSLTALDLPRGALALTDGRVAATELDGLAIKPLVAQAKELAAKDPLVVAIDRRAPFETFLQVLHSLAQSGARSFALRAKTGVDLRVLPFELPATAPPAKAPPSDFSKQVKDAKDRALDGSPSEIALLAIRRSYMKDIRRCYNDLLKQDATAGGKLVLSLEVAADGKLKAPKVRGLAPSFDACLAGKMKAWTFPLPEGEAVQVTLQLVAGDGPAELAPARIGTTDRPAPPDPEAKPLELVVSIAGGTLVLFSLSGQEGTAQAPKVTIDRTSQDALVELGKALEEIVRRRFTDLGRSAEDRAITVMAAGATPMQTIAEVAGAVRRTSTGRELFPTVRWAIAASP